ncbi:MAG: carboxymuconolactone decarboxylase family protein [Candidatus Tectomicrobia bacterium]|uniref:Carboxymuconolactone decarboxylase family protein n=1 Tax=Tectimicrobiota bacterium TaxID=2528274 RepID=A0A932HW00_UNCTE|nr:carboxymuconolactone decarboxylase family protein [Candidatus Tectomicrobia bacterium]
MDSPLLTPREKAAVLWAEHVTRNTARERDDVYEAAREHFSEAELVELTLMAGFFNMFNRFMDSLRIPLESEGEVNKIKRSVRLDPGTVKRYLEDAVAAWPQEFPRPDALAP